MLDVWLSADRVGVLGLVDGRQRFYYSPEWLARADSVALSPHHPFSAEPIDDRKARPSFAGLPPLVCLRRPVEWRLQASAQDNLDKADNQWNGLNDAAIETDPLKEMMEKLKEGEAYALMFPAPANADIPSIIMLARLKPSMETRAVRLEDLLHGLVDTKNYYRYEPFLGGTKVVSKPYR